MTRKRLLAALQAASGQCDEGFVQRQVQARDVQISILREKLFDVSARARVCAGSEEARSKDSLIGVLQLQVDALTSTATEQQTTIGELLLRENRELTRVTEEKEQAGMLLEAMQEELEGTKLKLTQRERMLQDSKGDLAQLAKIISDMTGINKELNEKIVGLNRDMEEINTANFQYKVKVENVEQLEATINSLMGNKAMYEKQFEKMTVNNGVLDGERKQLREAVDGVRKHSGEIAGKVAAWVKTIGEMTSWESVADEVKTTLLQVKNGLDEETMALERLAKGLDGADSHRSPSIDTDKKLSELKILDKEKSLQIDELTRSLSSLESSKATLLSRISTLESDLSTRRSDLDRLLTQKETEVRQLREQVDSLKQQSIALVEARNDHELMAAKAQTQVTVLMERLEAGKQGLENSQSKARLADQQQKVMLGQITQLNRQMAAREKDTVQKDVAWKQTNQKVKIMEQELWNKDSEILSRDAKIAEFADEIDNLRSEIDQSAGKARKMVAEQLADVHRLLEAKDHEIDILKGMLRSAQTQIKQKDVDIIRYKRKTGELPNEAYSPKKGTEQNQSQRGSSTNWDELTQAVTNFVSQIDRLGKFSTVKLDKITVAEKEGTVTPQWLKEELKLSKLPGENAVPREVLRGSLENRVSSLVSQVVSLWDRVGGGDDKVAEEVVASVGGLTGERWEGLGETLKKYGARVVMGGRVE